MDKMIHGPCNDTQSFHNYYCWDNKMDGQCHQQFPKQFQSCKTLEDSCFPLYRHQHEFEGESDFKLIQMVNHVMICVIQVDFIYHLL